MLQVKEPFRRRGFGSALMSYVENICEEEKLWTSTNQLNGPMQGLKREKLRHNLDSYHLVIFLS